MLTRGSGVCSVRPLRQPRGSRASPPGRGSRILKPQRLAMCRLYPIVFPTKAKDPCQGKVKPGPWCQHCGSRRWRWKRRASTARRPTCANRHHHAIFSLLGEPAAKPKYPDSSRTMLRNTGRVTGRICRVGHGDMLGMCSTSPDHAGARRRPRGGELGDRQEPPSRGRGHLPRTRRGRGGGESAVRRRRIASRLPSLPPPTPE